MRHRRLSFGLDHGSQGLDYSSQGIGSLVHRDWIRGFIGVDHWFIRTGSRVHRDWIGVLRVKTIGVHRYWILAFSGTGFSVFRVLDSGFFRNWILDFSGIGFSFFGFSDLDFATGVLRFDNTKMLRKSGLSEFFHMLFTSLPG